mgnify:CR=1 FL=1
MSAFSALAFSTSGFSASAFDFDGVSEEASDDTYAGGFWRSFENARARRRRRLEELEQAEDSLQAIKDQQTREIAQLLKVQERKDVEREEGQRIQRLAKQYANEQATALYGERVSKALSRAAIQGNFSAIEALMREVQRAQQEEEWLIQATIMAIELNG